MNLVEPASYWPILAGWAVCGTQGLVLGLIAWVLLEKKK